MTEHIEAEVRAFELELGAATDSSRACVRRFREVEDEDLRFLMAERLSALGSVIIPELNDILADPASSPGTRYLAAWVAVEVGDRGDSVVVLCQEVEAGSGWSLGAAGVLGRHRLAEGMGPLQMALERVDPQDGTAVLGYLRALRDLRGTLSESMRQRLMARADPWVARTVDDEFRRNGREMTTTHDYIATFPDELRPILTEVAEALRRALPGAEERIRYGMPAFMLTDRYALHFAGWKKHVGLYPVATLEPELEAEVAPYRAAKDTVKLMYRDPVPSDLVERIATALRAQHP